MEQKVFFKSSDGLILCGLWSIPDKHTTKVIILTHGITVDKDEDGVFPSLAKVLQDNGFAVLRFDFRGHGESEGISINVTIEEEFSDLNAAIQEAKNKSFQNIGLVGASFGGGISTLYAARNQNDLKCLCLWNPCLNYDHVFLHPFLPWIRDKKTRMKKDLKIKGWTTLGSNDFVLGKSLFDEMANLFPYKEIKKISIPLVIIHGDKDTYVPYEDSKDSITGMQNAKLIKIKNGEHGFHQPEKIETEVINETLKFFLEYL